jgi:hypothetical protein
MFSSHVKLIAYQYAGFLGDGYLQRFLATVYNRQIEGPKDVLPHIQWYCRPSDEACSDTLYNLCIMHLARWMHGTGHPRKLMQQGHITSELYEQDKSDRGLRARLLYLAATGSPLRLIGSGRETLEVCDHAFLLVSKP